MIVDPSSVFVISHFTSDSLFVTTFNRCRKEAEDLEFERWNVENCENSNSEAWKFCGLEEWKIGDFEI